jgi:putative ABC transport system ATP-binding protein
VSAPVLWVEEVYRFFHAGQDEVRALRGVSLSVRAGEFVAVVGPSGSGKSTLLACAAGLDDPDGGTVRVAGQRVSRVPERQRARLRAGTIGVLMQSGNLVEHLSVAQNVAMAQRAGRVRADRTALLARLGLADRAGAAPASLSGGEAARAGLAVALACDPALLLADEPTGELDSAAEGEVVALLREQADRGTAVLAATHSAGIALAADRVLALEDGRLRA